ncbi:Usp domain-containing protein [Psidium guajava]|nr:Usp domain-containing protein [Psidium guajava]
MEETRHERQQQEVMVFGADESELSLYALQWTLDRFFAPLAPHFPFKLVVVHAKPSPASVIGLAGPVIELGDIAGAIEVLPIIDADLRKIAGLVVRKAKDICNSRSVHDVTFQVMEGDARNVLCDAVEKHHASVLVVGSRGHGAIKRAILGSVSNYCSHHAHCTVLIVKRPKTNG